MVKKTNFSQQNIKLLLFNNVNYCSSVAQKMKSQKDRSRIVSQYEKQGSINHLKQLKESIRKGQQFCSSISEKDIDQFQQFYHNYIKLPLLDKSYIKNYKMRSSSINKESLLYEINLVDSAFFHTTNQKRLRITQILALYLFLAFPKSTSTLLFEILTGQGKSTTIACLAAILAMKGRYIDVITTNKILALRDVQQKSQFFALLNIKVDHNFPPQNDKTNQAAAKPKKCYNKGTIVYGTPFSYQVDLLFDEYKKKNTRNRRPYDFAIVDEVDSMFIDEKTNQTLLSSTFAGFNDLILPMRILWQTVVMNNIIKEGDKFILYKQGTKKGQIIKGEMNQVMKVIVKDIRQKFKNEIIPEWRLQYIQFSMQDWIWSAIQAAHVYKEDEHYVIEKGKIIPVDYRNTGCLQNNVEWENGLHQFLQIKHDLEVSVQSMTSNFMSNIGHFTRYKKIYGLTGTLGSNESKKFLQKTYKAQMIKIPPFLQRRLQIEPGFFMYSESQWIHKIVQRVYQLIKKTRSVLIICQTIKHAKVIEQAIHKSGIPAKSVRSHLTGKQTHNDNVGCQQIIIATNIAGRGTDLKTDQKLNQAGGLHVILSFMPLNLRVQMQARGRAGRNGAPGSSQLIVNHKQYFEDIMTSPFPEGQFREKMIEKKINFICSQVRDRLEASSMKKDLERVEEIRAKDRIFQYFCKTVEKIPDYQTNKAKRDALQQAWAMFLKKSQCLEISNQQIETKGKKLIDSFVSNQEQYYNHSHTIWRGIAQIKKNDLKKANQYFKSLNEPSTTITNKIAGRLMQSSINIKMDQKKKENYGKALQIMSSCLPIIEERKDIIKGMHSVSLSSNNRKIVGMMNRQNQKQANQLLGSFNHQKNLQKTPNKISSLKNHEVQQSQRKNIDQLMNIPQINVLNSISDHIKQQIKSIERTKKDEYADIKFEPLTTIIDSAKGMEEETQEAVDKLMADIPYVPVVEIKKIQIPLWKRAVVFAVGVMQICLGALLVGVSGGAAVGIGSFMIYSGFTDCMKAIFTPDVCDDLLKFYTKKAIEYTVQIALIGINGMSELARLAQKGFETIKNSSMTDVLQKAITAIQQGLVLQGYDWQGLAKRTIFYGLSQIAHNSLIGKDLNQKYKILQKPEIKQYINEGIQDENKIQIKTKQMQKRFQKNVINIIRMLISQGYQQSLPELNHSNLSPKHLQILIESHFDKAYEEYLGSNERNKIYKHILEIVSRGINDKNLQVKLIKDLSINDLIKTTIYKLSQSEDYQIITKNSKIIIRNQIVDAYNSVLKRYSQQFKILQKQNANIEQRINHSQIPYAQHRLLQKQHDQITEKVLEMSKSLRLFCRQFQQMDQGENVVDYLTKTGVLENGKVDKSSQRFKSFHPYTIEVLSKIQFCSNSNQSLEQILKECLQKLVYNSFVGMALKAIMQTVDNSSCSISKLKWIEEQLS